MSTRQNSLPNISYSYDILINNYERRNISKDLTAYDTYNIINELLDRILIYNKSPMWVFNDGERKLRSNKAIELLTYKGEEMFFAENEALGIYAIGETIDEAIKDFNEQIIHCYFYYKKYNEDEFTMKAKKIKEFYEKNFIEINI